MLWGTDNIKTYGESLAQVMIMVGVRPVSDALGRVNKLEVCPAQYGLWLSVSCWVFCWVRTRAMGCSPHG